MFKKNEPLFFFLVKHYQSICDIFSLYALTEIIMLDLTLATPFHCFLYYLGKVLLSWKSNHKLFFVAHIFISLLSLCFYESARQLVQYPSD